MKNLNTWLLVFFAITLVCFTAQFSFVPCAMQVDGVFYANIARNYAEGLGEFWNLKIAPNESFAEHPPLFLWVQSYFFKLFGDSLYIEHFFSLFLIVFVILAVFALAKTFKLQNPWIAPLLVSMYPLTHTMARWNEMESLLVLFSLFAVYCHYISSRITALIPSLTLTVIGLTFSWCAVLTKGPLGFFSFFAQLLPIFFSEQSGNKWRKRLLFEMVCFILVSSGFALWFIYHLDARHFFTVYFQEQLLRSLRGQREIDNPYLLVFNTLFFETAGIVVIILTFLKWQTGDWENGKKIFNSVNFAKTMKDPTGIFFVMFCASCMPMIVSPKNRVWFLFLQIPYLSLFLNSLISRLWKPSYSHFAQKKMAFLIILIWAIMLVGIFVPQNESLSPICKSFPIGTSFEIPKQWESASFCPESLEKEWALKAHLKRFKKIALVKTNEGTNINVIENKKGCANSAQENSSNTKYQLFRR